MFLETVLKSTENKNISRSLLPRGEARHTPPPLPSPSSEELSLFRLDFPYFLSLTKILLASKEGIGASYIILYS